MRPFYHELVEAYAAKIPIGKDSEYAQENRVEQINCIVSLLAYMSWEEKIHRDAG